MSRVSESVRSEVRWFQWACWGFAAVPLLVGSTVALAGGAGFDLVFGLNLGDLGPSLESNIRFLAVNFVAMGLIIVWSTLDVVYRSTALRIAFGAMIMGAVFRLVAIALHGLPSPVTTFVIGGELLAAPLLLWHARILHQLRPPTSSP